jgi:hypothetical protein
MTLKPNKMKKSALLFCLFIVGIMHVHAQTWVHTAESAAMGYTAQGMQSAWAVFNNPAGSAQIKNWTLGGSYSGIGPFQNTQGYQYLQLPVTGLVIAPLSRGNIHASYAGYSTENHSLHSYTLGYAHKFGEKFRMGAQYIFSDITIENPQNTLRHEHQIVLGAQIDLFNKLTLGASIRQYFRPYSSIGIIQQNRRYNIGAEYRISDRWLLRSDFIQDYSSVGAGVQFKANEQIFLRAGADTDGCLTGGLGVVVDKLQLDLSLIHRPSTGSVYRNVINISGAYKF